MFSFSDFGGNNDLKKKKKEYHSVFLTSSMQEKNALSDKPKTYLKDCNLYFHTLC